MKNTALIIVLLGLLFLGRGGVEAKKPTRVVNSITSIPTATVVAAVPTTANITEVLPKEGEEKTEVKWKGWNIIAVLMNEAVKRGVPENTIVLLLLLPIVATLVSFLHYVVGVSGYGIFMPTMMAVAFLATGIKSGILLFGVILAVSLLGNKLLRKMKLHFWPARAIALLLVGLAVTATMGLTASWGWLEVSKISIFPILFMVLLTEEFVRTQLIKSKKEAVRLTVGTLALAGIGALTMRISNLQGWVREYPEILIMLVVIINIIVGSYKGIRWTEVERFKEAIRKK